MNRTLLILNLFFWVPGFLLSYGELPVEQSPEAHFEELEQILTELEANAPLVGEERERLNEKLAGVLLADSAHGIKLSVNLQGQSIYEDRPNQRFLQRYRFFSSAYMKKPLYHWGAIKAESDIARFHQTISKNNYKFLLSELKSITRESYLDMILLRDQFKLNMDTLHVAEDGLSKIKKKKKLGLSNELQVNQANAILLERQIGLEDLNRSLRLALFRFREMTGWDKKLSFLDKNSSFEILNDEYDFNSSAPKLISSASSFIMEKIRKEIEIEKNRLEIANSGLKPKLNLVGGIFQDQIPLANNADSIFRNNILVGVEINWSIWDSSKSKAEKLRAFANKRRLEMNLERESRSYRLELNGMRMQLESLAKKVRFTRELVKVAKDRFRISEVELESDRITLDQLIEARVSLDQAKVKRLESICDFLKVRNRYEEMNSVKYE
tara:strand:+ start:2220 stop:3539 length:1320 start_codon:yes stop_codon:yes gene_type:complete